MMSFLRKAIKDQSGQSAAVLGLAMLSLCAMSGLTLDVGHAYFVRSQLQNAVNAAGLAAAGSIYNSTADSAKNVALAYLNVNPIPGLKDNTVSDAGTRCVDQLKTPPWKCSDDNTDNVVWVTESVSVPTTFMRVFGFKTMNISAKATASMQSSTLWNIAVIEDLTGSMGGTDSNCKSMSKYACTLNALQGFLGNSNPCPGTAHYGSACTPDIANLRVALFGFPNLVTNSSGAVDSVTNCSTTASFTVDTLPLENATRYDPMTYHYNYDSADHKLSASYELTYKVTNADENGFVSDYYDGSNTTDGKLNTSSALVKAIGYTVSDGSTHAGCLTLAPYETASNGAVSPTAAGAVQSNGDWQGSSGKDKYGNYPKVNTVKVGQGLTYIASAIYAAQAALTAEKARMAALGKVTHNAMIIQSDGGMNMQWIYFPHGLVTQSPPAKSSGEPSSGKWAIPYNGYNEYTPATIDSTLGYQDTTSKPKEDAVIASYITGGPGAEASGTINGRYPDFLDQCQQTIMAAQRATKAGTRVYSIGFGASTTSDCAKGNTPDHNDVTLIPTSEYPLALNVPFTLDTLTGCVEMKNAASSLDYFFAYSPSGTSSGCADDAHTTTSLASIFQAIQADTGTAHLVPNNAS
jgi:Flp pilus assembly protein TadG